MARYEDHLFDQIVFNTVNNEMSAKSQVKALMNKSNELLTNRAKIFESSPTTLRDIWLRSSDLHLMDGRGQCGSFSFVLNRLLMRAGYSTRIGQMYCAGTPGCHIFTEVKIDGKYIVLDPYFNLSYENNQGELASAQELKENWNFYKKQVPVNYNFDYNYEDYVYTNYKRIPLIGRVLSSPHNNLFKELSIRTYLLNLYRSYAIVLMIFYIKILLIKYFLKKKNKKSVTSIHETSSYYTKK